jgi:putative tryptophan/tyrosine transport system substrate-binding protein
VYRVAVLALRAAPMQTSIKETQAVAESLRLQLQLLEVKAPDEIESAFDAAKKQRADAPVQIEAAFFEPHQQRIIDLAAKHRLPVMYIVEMMSKLADLCPTGVLRAGHRGHEPMCSGNRRQNFKGQEVRRSSRGAANEIRILRQAENRQTNTIPPNVLARADKVMK